MRSIQKQLLCSAIVCIILMGHQNWLSAQFEHDSIRNSLATIARSTAKLLENAGLDSIGIGDFSGPPSFGSSSGAGIRQILKEEFAKVGISEKKVGAQVGIQGRYLLTDPFATDGTPADPRNQQLTIQADLVDRNGAVLSGLNVKVPYHPTDEKDYTEEIDYKKGSVAVNTFSQPAETGAILGATADLTLNNEEFLDNTVIMNSFDRSTAKIFNGNTLASSSQSPYRIQILVDGQPRAITLEDGQPFIELKKSETFVIRFFNQTQHEVGATVLLDGVNLFAFSEERHKTGPKRGEPLDDRYLLGANNTYDLKGWYVNSREVDQFKMDDFANSAAAKVGSTTNLGTITISVRAAWKEGQRPPAGEPEAQPASADIGVGFGDRVDQRSIRAKFPREYGIVRSLITIRYVRPK